MKKVALLMVLFLSVPAFAGIDYGLDAGHKRFGFFGGVVIPESTWSSTGVNFHPGEDGFGGGMEFFMNITSFFALGIELGYYNYPYKDFFASFPPPDGMLGPMPVAADHRVTSWSANGSIMARLYPIPHAPARIYIPFGIGYNYFESKVKNKASKNEEFKEHDSTYSLTAGVGIEFDLTPDFTFGVEGRYNYMSVSDSTFYGNDKMNNFQIMLKVGARFL